LASPKMMYVSEAGLLNTSGWLITNKICSSRQHATGAPGTAMAQVSH
jgi:hypothetical protein